MNKQQENEAWINYYASLLDCILDEVNVKCISQPFAETEKGILSLDYDGTFRFMLAGKDVTTPKLRTRIPKIMDTFFHSQYANR